MLCATITAQVMLIRQHRLDGVSQAQRVDVLTLTLAENLEQTQMALGYKTLSDIKKASEESEFVTSLYHWGTSSGGLVFIIGEYCDGGLVTDRIVPNVGIKDESEFWRLAFQFAQGLFDIHRVKLFDMKIQFEYALLTTNGDVRIAHLGLQRVDVLDFRDSELSTVGRSDQTADVHSLAVMIYRMSTGRAYDPSLGLQSAIRDPLKLELVSRVLHNNANDRPVAHDFLQIVTELSAARKANEM